LDNLLDVNAAELGALLSIAKGLKAKLRGTQAQVYRPLVRPVRTRHKCPSSHPARAPSPVRARQVGKTMSMIFQKRSTRTRVSAEAGMAQLGGHALFLGAALVPRPGGTPPPVRTSDEPPLPSPPCAGSEDIQLGKNESVRDTATVLSRFNDIILARVFEHSTITQLAQHSTVPIINALSDMHHPLQLLADAQTMVEQFGSTEGLTVAWVGDGNNILHTFLTAAAALKYNVRYACPPGYGPDAGILAASQALAARAGVTIYGTHAPEDAVRGADVIVTDTWVSMGQEAEAATRVRSFEGYRVTEALARRGGAQPGWKFLHCLPRKENEVDDEVFYGPRSVVWDEAENRKWTFMAVALAQLMGGAEV
jgi:ornithine carbamoyltransferase